MRKSFISFLSFLAALLFSSAALAEDVWEGKYQSPDAACTAVSAANTWKFTRSEINGANTARCWGTFPPSTSEYVQYTVTKTTRPDCPSGTVRNWTTQNCDSTAPKCNTPAGGKVSWTQFEGHSSNGTLSGSGSSWPSSSPTCGLSGSPDVNSCSKVKSDAGGYDHYCSYSGNSDGSNAPASTAPIDKGSMPSGSEPTNAPNRPADSKGNCPGGTVQSGMDSSGIPICSGSGTNPSGNGTKSPLDSRPTSSTTTTSTNSSGQKVETTTTTSGNSDGSTTTTTTTTTTGSDGGKTTTTKSETGNTPGGQQGRPDPDPSDLCKQHPDLTICKNSTVAGRCASISCTGDAIQCATLQQAAAMRCAKEDEDQALKSLSIFSLGQNVVNGADPDAASLPSNKNGVGVQLPSSLDGSGWLGGGSCFPDKTFSVQGKAVTIPFSQACGILVALRYALMVAASLVAFKTLRGAFLAE